MCLLPCVLSELPSQTNYKGCLKKKETPISQLVVFMHSRKLTRRASAGYQKASCVVTLTLWESWNWKLIFIDFLDCDTPYLLSMINLRFLRILDDIQLSQDKPVTIISFSSPKIYLSLSFHFYAEKWLLKPLLICSNYIHICVYCAMS